MLCHLAKCIIDISDNKEHYVNFVYLPFRNISIIVHKVISSKRLVLIYIIVFCTWWLQVPVGNLAIITFPRNYRQYLVQFVCTNHKRIVSIRCNIIYIIYRLLFYCVNDQLDFTFTFVMYVRCYEWNYKIASSRSILWLIDNFVFLPI